MGDYFESADEATVKHWRSRLVWSGGELAALCAGLVPGRNQPDPAAKVYGQALKDIEHAVELGILVPIKSSSTPEGRLYPSGWKFEPAKVVAWAAKRFEEGFPFKVTDFDLPLSTGTSALGLSASELPPELEAAIELWHAQRRALFDLNREAERAQPHPTPEEIARRTAAIQDRAWLIDWLSKNRSSLAEPARERVAIMINEGKGRGRRKS